MEQNPLQNLNHRGHGGESKVRKNPKNPFLVAIGCEQDLFISAVFFPLGASALPTFEIFSLHEDFHRFRFTPEPSLCSRLFSVFDFVFAFDFLFPYFSP